MDFYPLSFGSTPKCANEAAAAIAALVTAGKISPPEREDEMDDSSDEDIGSEVADSTDGGLAAGNSGIQDHTEGGNNTAAASHFIPRS